MHSPTRNTPSFFLLGAQKAGTKWLWNMLQQHPGTSLPEQKEIHYFGSSELYAKGDAWYLAHFHELDPNKVIGEASTSYFYDSVPYWYNKSDQIELDTALPPIPELILRRFPDARFIVILRDPVYRAVSAYFHWMKRGTFSPLLSVTKLAVEHPKIRILEYGLYRKYLETWKSFVDSDRLRILIFEDEIKRNPEDTLSDIYGFLGLDPSFKPVAPERAVHVSWTWTRIVLNYYTKKLLKGPDNRHKRRFARMGDRLDVLRWASTSRRDITFLRSVYLPEHESLSELTGKSLASWDYGERLLR